MDKQTTLEDLNYVVRILYSVLGLPSCNEREIQNELYPAIHSVERVITQIEQQDEINDRETD